MIRLNVLILSILLTTVNSFGQDTIKNLVFEGAGIKGIAYAGVIGELQERDAMNHLEKVGGTSAGAIIALAVALNYTPEEIEQVIYETKFNKLNHGFFGGITRTKKRFGYYKGKKVDEWIGGLISAKTGNADLTFYQMDSLGYKKLYTVATLLDQQRLITYSAESHPNMKVKDAVRASMSIPMYFEAMFIDSTGKVYEKRKDCDSCHTVLDGGIIGNYPIFMFDTVINSIRIPNPYTVGIRIDDDEQINYDSKRKGLAPKRISSFKKYVEAFYEFTIETANRSSLTEADWARTISVSSGHIGPKIKNLSVDEKNLLINNGIAGTKHFFTD